MSDSISYPFASDCALFSRTAFNTPVGPFRFNNTFSMGFTSGIAVIAPEHNVVPPFLLFPSGSDGNPPGAPGTPGRTRLISQEEAFC